MEVGINVRRHPEGGVLTGQTYTDPRLQQPGTKTPGNSRAILSHLCDRDVELYIEDCYVLFLFTCRP